MKTNQPGTTSDKIAISGVVDHIIFHNPENGYTVCVLRSNRQTSFRGTVTVVGTCPLIWAGETLQAEGHWQQHETHGLQFNAAKIVCIAPTTTEGIKRYLASGMIDGIGPVLAERLVKKFGDKTLEVIERQSALLETVEGIGRKRREQIKTAWMAQLAVRDIMLFTHSHHIGTSQANRIYRAYGEDAIKLISENPYRLATDIWGIGFRTADKIAGSLGIPLDSIHRACAGIIHALQKITEEGHCYAKREQLLTMTAELLEITYESAEKALEVTLNTQSVVLEDDRLYLPHIHRAETGVARQMKRLQDHCAPPVELDIEKALVWAQNQTGLDFAPAQRQALQTALTEKITLITGGPGVGKTTIIRALTDIWRIKKMHINLTAPTGRAAKRMEETTGCAAMTIHRLLQFRPDGRFEYTRKNPLPTDVVILDETSMVDVSLMYAFLCALPDHARLVLVGDPDQLPSVGPGNILRDILESRTIPGVKLDTVFRQSARSWIVHNAHLVNSGQSLETSDSSDLSDFYFIREDDPERIIKRTLSLVTKRIPKRFHLDPRIDIQVLSPMRRYQLGADALNLALQTAINPTGPSVQHTAWHYRLGDRVMQLRNNYDKEVYNGDIGFIIEVDSTLRQLTIDFDGRGVIYKAGELDEISLAYACSIHKSQGSEYPAVVILMATQHYHLLQRNLLYTAITRGRKLVCLIGSQKAVGVAIRNNHIELRQTFLKAKLSEQV